MSALFGVRRQQKLSYSKIVSNCIEEHVFIQCKILVSQNTIQNPTWSVSVNVKF